MPDKLTPTQRSRQMSRIRSKNTAPELTVRRTLHRLGYRFRLHGPKLPGKPDLVFPGRRAVIFVHGCFWHQHPDPACKRAFQPKTRSEYWQPKLEENRRRDARNRATLEAAGWRVLELWECQLTEADHFEAIIRSFLGPSGQANMNLKREVKS